MVKAETINKVVAIYRELYGDNAVEALVGLLSTLTSEEQMQRLIELKRKEIK